MSHDPNQEGRSDPRPAAPTPDADPLAALRADNERLERLLRDRTAELAAAREEVEAFTWSVSHDLRAPVRRIAGFVQALVEDYGDALDASGRDFLARAVTGAEHLQGLLDDLLALSRVTGGPLEREEVDLSALAAAVVAELRRAAPERAVEVDIEPDLRASADPRLVRVLLEQLLGNAWKFTAGRATGHIAFGRLAPEQRGPAGVPDTIPTSRPVYCVRDDGAGFEPARADRLFAAFQRLHDTREFPGNGIGLAMVRRVTRRHGGQVWARGEVDRGAAFSFTL
jgi:signal transduction histidine kinase